MCSFITRCWTIALNVIQRLFETQKMSENALQLQRKKKDLLRVENEPF